MADVRITPRIQCDNCGAQAEKQPMGGSWFDPNGWGSIDIDGTQRGSYPNRIRMADLCPPCLAAVHSATTEALRTRREEVDHGR